MSMMNDHQDSNHFTYDRTWDEIETMLDRAERQKNQWRIKFIRAKENKDFQTMKECARNSKALEGVIKTLRWTLGDMNIMHPLS